MNIRFLVLLLCFLMSASVSAADDKEAVRTACKADVKANCGTVFTRSQVIGCLVEKAAVLSAPCTDALKVASCNPKSPANLKAAFVCAQ
jgi:hypothetical protein